MVKIEKTSSSIGIIGGSDGPTAIFLAGKGKQNLKQRIHKRLFELRKKWYSRHIKPDAHTMDEVISYIKGKYGFTELAKDEREYLSERDSLRTSFIMQYKPELLGEYAEAPKLLSRDEDGIRAFQEQFSLREQRAKEISEDVFSIDYHILKKTEKGSNMQICIETTFGYIGGGFTGSGKGGKRLFEKIYKDIYRYYGVTVDDIANETPRYKTLLTTLAMKN